VWAGLEVPLVRVVLLREVDGGFEVAWWRYLPT